MVIAVLLAGPGVDEPSLGPDAAGRLGELGVSQISVLGDASGIGVVLEGWAFDPACINDALRAMFPVGVEGVRVLREIERVVPVTPNERRDRSWSDGFDRATGDSSR